MSMTSEQAVAAVPRRSALQRLSIELIVLVLVKIALLTLLWWFAFASHPKPDRSPEAISQLLGPTSQPSEARP